MKKLLLLLVLALGSWLAWTRFQPLSFDGDVVPERSRVLHVSGERPFDPGDKLEADVWTLILYTSAATPDERTLARRLEVMVREDLDTLRLVVVSMRDLESPVAQQHHLEELPTLWLYDGYRQVTRRRVDIERAVFGE